MSNHRLSLAEQIAKLDAAPTDFDPEDVFITGTDPGQEDAGNRHLQAAREHYIDVGPSTLRKYRDSIADPKYEGVTTTRKSLLEGDSAQEGSEEDEERDGSGGEDEQLAPRERGDDDEIEKEDDDDENDNQNESSNDDAEGKGEAAGYPFTSASKNAGHEEQEQDMSADLRRKREEDKRKGKAVSRQMAIWDALLEARIRMQKAVTVTNLLPAPSDMDAFIQQPECREALNNMLDEALLLADELADLQEYLLTKNEDISLPPRKRQRLDDGDYDDQLEVASREISAVEQAIHPWLIQTLNKWSAKIQAVSPSVLLPSNRNAFSKRSQHLKSAVELAEEALKEYDKLLSRTRTWRGKERRIGTMIEGQGTVDEEDLDRFDDTDFYQQLLRDVIDSKGNGGGVDDWMTIQKEKKAKKKVDTRASKGRKVRYHVHEKMQNFMVPVPVVGAWHEEQIDELFSSLLGKGYEVENT
ncbi:hypothetical protein APHAL10511_002204 [Amanita phalloides]|nr:hypothetical protein APHAL10511_002204 [Amanita phalloides]